MNKNKKLIVLLISISFLASCSGHSPKYYDFDVKDTNAFNILINQYANNIEKIWGVREVLIAGPKDYVQYEENLQTRIHINFLSGLITIETLSSNPKQALKEAISSTLLMSEPVELIRDKDTKQNLAGEPFLLGQVLDQNGEPIRWGWRANSFADYLVENRLKKRRSDGKKITYVNIKLVANHADKRVHKFLPLVNKASKRYSIEEKLVLAIIEVESAFNPYAVSSSNALGLMQIQPHTAGHDIFKLRGLSGKPSRKYLLDPNNNIDMGTAYLALIKNKYLAGINHPLSMRYAMIVAFNGGAGSVLRTFSDDRDDAIRKINSLTPQQVYAKLVSSHISQESRNYLIKVSRVLEKL